MYNRALLTTLLLGALVTLWTRFAPGQTALGNDYPQLTEKSIPSDCFLFINRTGRTIGFLRFRVHGSDTEWFHSPFYKQVEYLADGKGFVLGVPLQPPIYDFEFGIQNEKDDSYSAHIFDAGWDMRQYYLMEIAKDSDGKYHLYFLKRSGF